MNTPITVYPFATKAGMAIPLDVAMPVEHWVTKNGALEIPLLDGDLRVFSVLSTLFAELVITDAVTGDKQTHCLYPNMVANLAIRVQNYGNFTITPLDSGEVTIAANQIVRWAQMDNQNFQVS